MIKRQMRGRRPKRGRRQEKFKKSEKKTSKENASIKQSQPVETNQEDKIDVAGAADGDVEVDERETTVWIPNAVRNVTIVAVGRSQIRVTISLCVVFIPIG